MDGRTAQKRNSYFRNASDLVDPPLYVVSQNLSPCRFLEKLYKTVVVSIILGIDKR